MNNLDSLYLELTGMAPVQSALNEMLISYVANCDWTDRDIRGIFSSKPFLSDMIKKRRTPEYTLPLFECASVVVLYYLVHRKPHTTAENPILTHDEMMPMYTDLGRGLH